MIGAGGIPAVGGVVVTSAAVRRAIRKKVGVGAQNYNLLL